MGYFGHIDIIFKYDIIKGSDGGYYEFTKNFGI